MKSLLMAHDDVVRIQQATGHAITILPDAIHAVWSVPSGPTTQTIRLQDLKAAFIASLQASVSGRMTLKEHRRITLKMEHIRRTADVPRYVDYCHFAPVRYGWVRHPSDWAHSSLGTVAVSEMILS